jgi:hypothetical protein
MTMSELQDKIDLLVEKMEEVQPLADWLEANKVALQGVIDGTHKIVPVEPTEAMQRAYYEAIAKAAREDFQVDPGPWDELPMNQRKRLAELGRAMVRAAA